MARPRFGISVAPQGSWTAAVDAATKVDSLGYDYLFTWDHLLGAFGGPEVPMFEGWTFITALAANTRHVRVGLLVGAVGFRHPTIVAAGAATLDAVTNGRVIVGLGAGWLQAEHRGFGLPFPSLGERLDRLDEAAGVIRALLDGSELTHRGPGFDLESARLPLRPVQDRLPILIGGWGPRRTPAIVARRADIWNAKGSPKQLQELDAVVRQRCDLIGRDPGEIERSVTCRMVIRDSVVEARAAWLEICRMNGADPGLEEPWLGPPEVIARRAREYHDIGFRTIIASLPSPYDDETIGRLAKEVAPLVQ
jgi:alkanesulfonate monooxygenase SsuD/methylene tetrahydromethanopterin reductase-like flavin-dependent oxidoreductase (luciferase family)